MEILGDVGDLESCFFLFGNSVSAVQDKCMVCARHTIGLEIILDASDGTLADEAQLKAHSVWR